MSVRDFNVCGPYIGSAEYKLRGNCTYVCDEYLINMPNRLQLNIPLTVSDFGSNEKKICNINCLIKSAALR